MEDASATMASKVPRWYVEHAASGIPPLTILAGQDLQGNTYWEFKDALNHQRLRRIVKYRHQTHFADVQVSPQWHQWLRQTRRDAPTLQEQTADVQRQAQLKYNARLADERWAAKARYIETPQPTPQLAVGRDPGLPEQERKVPPAVDTPMPKGKEDPFKKHSEIGTNPGAMWQPEAWTPGAVKR